MKYFVKNGLLWFSGVYGCIITNSSMQYLGKKLTTVVFRGVSMYHCVTRHKERADKTGYDIVKQYMYSDDIVIH